MKESKMVSIIIPVYNGARFLSQAIDSALAQTYPYCEVIVVNDGSDDQQLTREVALAYGNKIRYIEKENGGVSSALNCGIRHMKGDYFCWLSHDDLFFSEKVECQMRLIEKSGNEMLICMGNYQLFKDESDKGVFTEFQHFFSYNMIERPLFLFLWGELHFSSLLFHKNHFERSGIFDESLSTAQDNEFLFRLMPKQKLAFTEANVSRVRLHSESGTSRFHNKVNLENCKIYLNGVLKMTQEDIGSIVSDISAVYYKIGGIIKSMEGNEQLCILKQRMKELGISEEQQGVYKKLQDTKLVIFGAGEYGIRLKYELNRRRIFPICFIDNALDKMGRVVDGIPCYPVSYMKQHKEYLAIIAQKYYLTALEQLQQMAHFNVMLKQEADALLLQNCK